MSGVRWGLSGENGRCRRGNVAAGIQPGEVVGWAAFENSSWLGKMRRLRKRGSDIMGTSGGKRGSSRGRFLVCYRVANKDIRRRCRSVENFFHHRAPRSAA